MQTSRLPLIGLLLAAPLLGRAQAAPTTEPAVAAPRFYVGLAAYSSFYQSLGYPARDNFIVMQSSSFRLPVQLTAGYQLGPRWAAQVGLAYSSGTMQYGQTTVYSASSPGAPSPYYTNEGHRTQKQLTSSVLGRYTLTANPTQRLQFDALGGFTLERSTASYQGTATSNSQGTPVRNDYDYSLTQNTLLLTGGVGVRYHLGSRLALTYDFTVNKALKGDGLPIGTNLLTTSHALGLRYQFGK